MTKEKNWAILIGNFQGKVSKFDKMTWEKKLTFFHKRYIGKTGPIFVWKREKTGPIFFWRKEKVLKNQNAYLQQFFFDNSETFEHVIKILSLSFSIAFSSIFRLTASFLLYKLSV